MGVKTASLQVLAPKQPRDDEQMGEYCNLIRIVTFDAYPVRVRSVPGLFSSRSFLNPVLHLSEDS